MKSLQMDIIDLLRSEKILSAAFQNSMILLYIGLFLNSDNVREKDVLLAKVHFVGLLTSRLTNPVYVSRFLELIENTGYYEGFIELTLHHTQDDSFDKDEFIQYTMWEIFLRPSITHEHDKLKMIPLSIRHQNALKSLHMIGSQPLISLWARIVCGNNIHESSFWHGACLPDEYQYWNEQQLLISVLLKDEDRCSRVNFGLAWSIPRSGVKKPFGSVTDSDQACQVINSVLRNTLKQFDCGSFALAYQICMHSENKRRRYEKILWSIFSLAFVWRCQIELTLLPSETDFMDLAGNSESSNVIDQWLTPTELYNLLK